MTTDWTTNDGMEHAVPGRRWMVTESPAGPAGLVDVGHADAVDLDRLERATALRAERVGAGRYRVTGGSQDHWVDLVSPGHPRCDCGDHLWREQVCKHILAALLREGHAAVVAALGAVTARLRERLREATAAPGTAKPGRRAA